MRSKFFSRKKIRRVDARRRELAGPCDPESAGVRQPSQQNWRVPCDISRTSGKTCPRSYGRPLGRGKFQNASEDKGSSMASNDIPERQSSSNATCSTYPTRVERSEAPPALSVILAFHEN